MTDSPEFKLIDELFEIKFEGLIDDFKVMSDLVQWSDSWSRIGGVLHFHFLKDFVGYSCYLQRNKDLPQYIKGIIVYVRKPDHRLDYEDKKIQEFKDFISKRFKKYAPQFQKREMGDYS